MTAPAASSSGPGFTARLLAAQALVLVAGAVTTWLVASVIGPQIFHQHLMRAHVAHTAAETTHVEQAFGSALLISIAIAVAAAALAALAVSWYLSHRVQRSITQVANAASGIAAGRYGARVPDPGARERVRHPRDHLQRPGRAALAEATESTRRRMLADLAHEMRTPRPPSTPTSKQSTTASGSSTRTPWASSGPAPSGGRRLAEDITSVSRAEEGNLHISPHPIDPTDLVQSATAAARDHVATGVQLAVDLQPVGLVRADPDRIAQVLATSSTTHCATPRPAAPSPSPAVVETPGSSSPSPTPARASTQSTSTTCSTASTASTPPGTATEEAPEIGPASPEHSSRPTTATSQPTAQALAPAPPSPCCSQRSLSADSGMGTDGRPRPRRASKHRRRARCLRANEPSG